MDNRLEEIISVLEKMASGDMSLRLKITDKRDHVDALAFGINILADEIVYKQQLEQKRRHDLELAHLQLTKTLNDLRMTQEQLIQAAKLAILGEVCAGLAHEVSTPLTTISGYVDTIAGLVEKNANGSPTAIAPYIEKTQRQIDRVMEIVSHIRDFSRKSEQNFAPVAVCHIVDASLLLFENQFRTQSIHVERNQLDREYHVNGNFTLLEQVLINILANAKDALLLSPNKNDRKIRINIAPHGSRIKIEIFDNGAGLNLNIPDIKTKVFDPFFTTKTAGQGTGIGLSISQGIVQSHRGSIYIDKAEDYSTVVTIELPLHSFNNCNP